MFANRNGLRDVFRGRAREKGRQSAARLQAHGTEGATCANSNLPCFVMPRPRVPAPPTRARQVRSLSCPVVPSATGSGSFFSGFWERAACAAAEGEGAEGARPTRLRGRRAGGRQASAVWERVAGIGTSAPCFLGTPFSKRRPSSRSAARTGRCCTSYTTEKDACTFLLRSLFIQAAEGEDWARQPRKAPPGWLSLSFWSSWPVSASIHLVPWRKCQADRRPAYDLQTLPARSDGRAVLTNHATVSLVASRAAATHRSPFATIVF